ncbi:MAG: transposase [Pyrinomonadaceae bacterium]
MDHVHALVGVPATMSSSQGAKALKGDSSYGLRREFPGMAGFGWQDGYGVFSVSKSTIPTVVRYIKSKREHHSNRSFEEEYVALLKKHGTSTMMSAICSTNATESFFIYRFRGFSPTATIRRRDATEN